jgi:hypothetical protein
MRLGDLLIQAGRVTEAQVEQAMTRGARHGGRLGQNLVAIGAIDERVLQTFLRRIPVEPVDLAATGVDETELIALLLKIIYTGRLETVRQYVQAIKLPYHIVHDLLHRAVDSQFLHTLGTHNSDSLLDMSYAFTELGRKWTVDALERLHYVGPAPIPLEQYSLQVSLQKLTNEIITVDRVRSSIAGLEMDPAIVEQVGPALNSGRAILLYGPPGNGKTSVALRFASVFHDVIYIPYSVFVEGQIIRVFDPSVHHPVDLTAVAGEDTSFVRQDEPDSRWVACRRPFVITGGELTMEMLDLRYDTNGHYYEAPLHMKALGGCFLIDDFGRQLVSPAHLLNRWIVPLESRIDYLKLHTGKSFSIPFEEMVIFSTNLEPEDLMDPAFLRRLPYKIEVGSPTEARYRRILEAECERHGLTLTDDVFVAIIDKIKTEKGMELAAYQPRFIIDQVIATCRFLGQQPHFEPRFLNYAIDNLRVKPRPA